MTAIMWASQNCREGCLRLLIASGANVEHKDKVCECECAVWSMGEVGRSGIKKGELKSRQRSRQPIKERLGRYT